MSRFAGQTALVTGGSRGLGRAIAQQLAGEGARVYAGFLRRAEAADETVRGAPGGGSIAPLPFDVTDAAACETAVERIVGDAGRLDVVVHAAGLVRDSLFALSSPEDWDEPVRVNLGGALRVARAAVRTMLTAGGGAIVFVGSVAGLRASPGQAGYAASKGGIAALTSTLAAELAPRGIRVNAVVPGLIAAGMAARLDRRVVDRQLARIPVGRLGQAAEVAACALFLASPAASYVIGQSLVVDGGLSI